MRHAVTLALVLALAVPAAAQDLGTQAPVKVPQSYPENIPDPERQGGDTIFFATFIPMLPYEDSGTTVGRVDDYDEICPYSGATAPDVVYKYVATMSQPVDIDLCGSAYDTKVYVYDASLDLVACNDDFYFGPPCGEYVSKIDHVWLDAGTTYYIIIDGYGGACGLYQLHVVGLVGTCYYHIPNTEGEPLLVDDYVDIYNGGCNSPPDHPFQEVAGDSDGEAIISGVSGWYIDHGSNQRDTDWFVLFMGPQNAIAVTICGVYATYAFELGPQVCETVGVVQQCTSMHGATGDMIITGYVPLAPVWFWVGPTVFAPPAGAENEYNYNVWLSGLAPTVFAEATTWSTVKALYN
jgi:hypothetical protein